MRLEEAFARKNRVHPTDLEAKQRFDYSVSGVWQFKRSSALEFATSNVSALVASVLKAPRMQAFMAVCDDQPRVALAIVEENERRAAAHRPLLTPECEEVKAFAHYITQTLRKSRFSAPRWDDWAQNFYESNGGYSDLMPGVEIPKVLTGLVTNYEEAQRLFSGFNQQRAQEIETILEHGNLVIVSNHCTWLNLPLIVSFLHQELGIPLNRINTVLGPALTTYKQGLEVAGISNLIKTIPDTPNGRLDNVAPELQKRVRKASIRLILERLKIGGQVIVMSPGGTTDRVTSESIELLEASKATQSLVKSLAKTSHVWPIATHTGALYAGHKIRAGRFQFHEEGILPPGGEINPIRALKHHMRTLNPDRTVTVFDEEGYTQKA